MQSTPQTIASGQTPITIDWDYLNLAYGKNFPSAKIRTAIPSDAVYGAFYCQAINATAPHPWAARLWQEFLYSDQGQLLWLKGLLAPGAVHRHGQAEGSAESAPQRAAQRGRVREGALREPRSASQGCER